MTNALIEAGTLTANREDRIVSGLLLPYGEQGRTNLGRFTVEPGRVTIPQDVTVLAANTDHRREDPVARFVTAVETPAGVVASFHVGRNPEGDSLLAEIASDSTDARKQLSVEIANVVLKAGRLVSGRLFGAAFVKRGAFPSATVLAADVEDEEPQEGEPAADATEPTETVEKFSDEFTDENGVTYKRTGTRKTRVDGDKTTITETIEIIEPKETPVGDAPVPNTLDAAHRGTAKAPSFREVMTLLASATAGGQAPTETLLAAFNDIKFDAAGSAGIAQSRPQWLNELWSGRSFERRIVPLFGHDTLTALVIEGWRWLQKAEMAAWAGNKANVPSNTPTTELYRVQAQRFAGGHDIAREYRDFPSESFWTGYFRSIAESYARLSDGKVLTDILAAATPIVRGAVPAGVAPGMVSIVDGALAVLDEGLPEFAIVAPDVWRDTMLTRENDRLAFLNTSLGLEDGTVAAFKIIPDKRMTAGQVLVGMKAAATVHELGETPIKVESLDLIRGGVDEAAFGYVATVIHDAPALALVRPAA